MNLVSATRFSNFHGKLIRTLGQAKLASKKNPHVSTPRQKFKSLVRKFLNVKLRNLYVEFQPSSFQIEGGERGDGQTDGWHAK